MSEEEMQRKMEFIVNQQAQFAVDIQQLQESQVRLTDAVITVVGVVGKLSEAQERTDAAMAEMAKAHAEMAKAHAETDERLNIFINVVERYISRNGGNGNAQEN